jgi:hypothetical protein
MATEMAPQPRIMKHGDGEVVLESSPEVISSSHFEFTENGSCSSGEEVSEWSSPAVARAGNEVPSSVTSLSVGTAARGTSLIPDLVIMNPLSTATKSEATTVPRHQQN